MSRLFFAVTLLVAGALAACTAAPDDGVGAHTEAQTGSLGILAIERASGGTETSPASLGAAFARYQGVDGETVARFLGAGSESASESCVLRTNDADALVASNASVELLDVGAISVRAGGTVSRLPPRAFPELARVAGGFFYADEAVVPAAASDGGEYVFSTEGSTDVASFEVVAPGPPDVADVRVDGALPDGVVRSQGTEVTWAASDPRDELEIEVQTTTGTLVCRANDDGAFHISASALTSVGADADARLVVRRIRTTPFDAPGLDEAYVRIASSSQYALVVR